MSVPPKKPLERIFFIPHNAPSQKNSKQWTGKMLISSKTTQAYKKKTNLYWLTKRQDFAKILTEYKKPYHIGLYFVRDSQRKFDYINAAQVIFDMMQKYQWIDDDNANIIVPVFLGYTVNKLCSGTYICLMSHDETEKIKRLVESEIQMQNL